MPEKFNQPSPAELPGSEDVRAALEAIQEDADFAEKYAALAKKLEAQGWTQEQINAEIDFRKSDRGALDKIIEDFNRVTELDPESDPDIKDITPIEVDLSDVEKVA